jgi:hypothetical protein
MTSVKKGLLNREVAKVAKMFLGARAPSQIKKSLRIFAIFVPWR